MLEVLEAVIGTMNKIEVKGKENLDMMLGCIQTLEKLKEAVKEKAGEVNTIDNHNEQRADV